MNKNKLRTAAALIAASILVLVLFQAYWLGKNWDDTYRRLRREVGVILRETVVRQQMAHMVGSKGSLRINIGDTTVVALSTKATKDTLPLIKDTAKTRAMVNLVVVNDSGRKNKTRFMTFDPDRPNDDDDDQSRITVEFPMPKGSANIDTIKQRFSQALRESAIPLDFTLQTVPIDTNHRGNNRRADVWMRGGPGNATFSTKMEWVNIQAVSSNTFLFLLQKMLWQLVFAAAMMLVIIAALLFLWRNLRLQHRLAEQKNDLIANITHELKTPIATVSVAIEALKNFNAIHDTERTKEYLNISGYELQRLNMLVDKVLKLSMFDQNKISLQQERVDLKQLMAEVLESMRLQLERQGATVKFEYIGDNFMLLGDRMHLLSVLYNLLDNAVKYSSKSPLIKILLRQTEGQLELQVSDEGIGIPTEHLTKIFEKFYRVPHGDTHNIKGYGLGLSYVAEVVKRHNGKITVDSELGKGSAFKVDLPTNIG